MSARRRAAALVSAVLAGAALLCAASPTALAAPSTLRLGFSDNIFVAPGGSSALDRAKRSGGGIVRLYAEWSAIAPTRPASGADPGDPAYRFGALDTAVRAAVARGLEPFVMTTSAPAWAEGSGRPAPTDDGPDARVGDGAWKPDVAAFGDFAAALTRRYAGTYAPPGATALPHVRRFQAWNEPNLNSYLAPQWERRDGKLRAFAPAHYRLMLNAFASAVRRFGSRTVVITAGTSPYGNPAGEWRRRPLAFWRDALCVSAPCSGKARFDVLAHHPYGSPVDDSFSADDLPVRGMGRLVSLLRGAERRGRVAGPGRHRVWVTEIGIETSPPDPDGVPEAVQATYLQSTLYLLWKAGVDTVTWFQVVDEARGVGYPSTVQAGLFQSSGKAKRAVRAFGFPFATDPDRPRVYWGLAPRAGTVLIERRSGNRWVLVRRVRAGSGRVFTGRGPWESGSVLRARQGKATSLSWTAL